MKSPRQSAFRPWHLLLTCLGILLFFGGEGGLRAEPRSFTVDGQASRIQVLVNREGLFALLAHDHVLVADQISGRIILDQAKISASEFNLRIPVNSIRVDPPKARKELDLAGELGEEDRKEIRGNMLADDQLSAGTYSEIKAKLARINGSWPNPTLGVAITIKDATRVINIPVKLELRGDVLETSGEFPLLQRDFGIEPYSALLGSIAVEDQVRIRFRILARENRP